ncbi:hypothetical protein N7474_005559 [Penicillium riverlandense]|uniref:uncharacterized protein n=1 Tax=Penicillium riverlandense TaxID=1903569 RepID=UPI0025467F5B|nr:uncharacterized protein N7474_005559 [Penicillium riverlandense]KAJ5819968.1 hypothetical protein N7474_005559 [Penicillium riverlandense]
MINPLSPRPARPGSGDDEELVSRWGRSGLASSDYTPPGRNDLERLIIKHGYPTPIVLSSLRDLTATQSPYNPPSRSCSCSNHFETRLSPSTTRPIPIPRPRRPPPIYDDLPVTPLTGRFETDVYLREWELSSLSARSQRAQSPLRSGRRGRHYSSRTSKPSRMRADHSPFDYSSLVSPTTMSRSPRRSSSPPPPRSLPQNQGKSVPGFQLGSLPRFHPAVYQSTSTSHNATGQPSSPRQSRQHHTYRTSSGSRDMMWQYRDWMDNGSPGPSAPRLDPLSSPGPVTPLALEDAQGYFVSSGSAKAASERASREVGNKQAGPSPELVEKLIARENERTRQKNRKSAKGWP